MSNPIPPPILGDTALRTSTIQTLKVDTELLVEGPVSCESLVSATGITATTGDITATAGSHVGLGHVYSSKPTYTQITSAVTPVPITTNAGTVTTFALTTATTASTVFTLTGVNILATSKLMITPVAYSGVPLTDGIPMVFATSVVAGTATVTVSNFGANALNGTMTFNYMFV